MNRETYLDKEVGFKFTTEERTITEEELGTFYQLWEATETLFTDDDFTKSLELGYKGKIVAGMFLTGVMLGKLDMPSTGGGHTFNAILVGMNDIKFMSPAYPGNRLRLNGELLKKKMTSKGHVLVDWKWTLLNQDNTAIASGVNTELFPKAMMS